MKCDELLTQKIFRMTGDLGLTIQVLFDYRYMRFILSAISSILCFEVMVDRKAFDLILITVYCILSSSLIFKYRGTP
jgi:hypothetical protein